MADQTDELSTIDDWQEFFAPIGRLIVQFAKLEYVLGICLQRVLGITREQIELIEESLQSVDEMKKLLTRSVKLMGGEADAVFTKLLQFITHAITFRNKVTHGFWFSQQWSDLYPDRTATKLVPGKIRRLSLSEMSNETRKMVRLTYYLIYWADQFYGPKRIPEPTWP